MPKGERKPWHLVVEIGAVGLAIACCWLWFSQQQISTEAALKEESNSWIGMPIQDFLREYPKAQRIENPTEAKLVQGNLPLAPIPRPIPGQVFSMAHRTWSRCFIFEKDGRVHAVVPYRT